MLERASSLCTDLYELTMAAAYFENGLNHKADFELFVRSLPPQRSYLIAAGVEEALDYLSTLRLTGSEVDYLREHPVFKKVSREFFDYLLELRFTGDVWAMPEGTAAFAMEPFLRVTAPIIEAQVVETFLLSVINFETLIASKAARVVTAARGRDVIDFGTRRAHGSEAGLLAARASYLGGCDGTSNVEAGYLFGIPTFGTLAHSYVMSFDDEGDAFRSFLRVFPETATLLVDTYDTIAAVERIASTLGPDVPAVRLDSGDILDLSVRTRRLLDAAGMTKTKIFVSSDLNEYRIAELLDRGAPIDGFGVGTDLATSYDSPALSGVYKLVSQARDGRLAMRIKISPNKPMYPGPKQVWRYVDREGYYVGDILTLAGEQEPGGEAAFATLGRPASALLEQVMAGGRVLDGKVAGSREARLARLTLARTRAAEELRRLPASLRRIDQEASPQACYPVRFSETLKRERARLEEEFAANLSGFA